MPLDTLPKVRGSYRENTPLANVTWFRVGGPAEILFKPADADDLQSFLKQLAPEIPVTVIGVGSNLLVRDGGVDGVVIRLGRELATMRREGDHIIAGAGALDVNVAEFAAQEKLTGLEFLVGIPGTIGGALAMNAGAYGKEIKDVLVRAKGIDRAGNIREFSMKDFGFHYRGNDVGDGWIFIEATLKATPGNETKIRSAMQEIQTKRAETQPIRTRTGGSTFANPDGGKKAWQLIDEAGLRGLQIGGAKVSEMHCNFLENTGNATAAELEEIGETVRAKVKEKSGVELRWEIKRIGK